MFTLGKLLIVVCIGLVKFSFWMVENNPPGGTPKKDQGDENLEAMQTRALEAQRVRNEIQHKPTGGSDKPTDLPDLEERVSLATKRVVETANHKLLQEALRRRCKRVDDLIKSRFGPTELTATRYRLLIDEVRLGVLANIERQIELEQSVLHLDRAEIEQRLRTDSSTTVRGMLGDRLQILDHVEKRLAELETANEQALNTLDRAILALVDAEPLRRSTSAELQRSVSDLEELLGRTHRYGATGVVDETAVETDTPELTGSTKKKKPPKITPGAS